MGGTSHTTAPLLTGTYYVVQSISGTRNITFQLLGSAPQTLSSVSALSSQAGFRGADNQLFYPVPSNGVASR